MKKKSTESACIRLYDLIQQRDYYQRELDNLEQENKAFRIESSLNISAFGSNDQGAKIYNEILHHFNKSVARASNEIKYSLIDRLKATIMQIQEEINKYSISYHDLKYVCDYNGYKYWYEHKIAVDRKDICLATKDPEKYCNGFYLYSQKDPGSGKNFVVVETNNPNPDWMDTATFINKGEDKNQPTTSNQQQATSNQQQATSNHQPVTINQ